MFGSNILGCITGEIIKQKDIFRVCFQENEVEVISIKQ